MALTKSSRTCFSFIVAAARLSKYPSKLAPMGGFMSSDSYVDTVAALADPKRSLPPVALALMDAFFADVR